MSNRSKHTRDYASHLKSAQWRTIRAQVLYRDGLRCRRCGRGGKGLEAHHLSYARLGCEDLHDLITLCPSCHDAVHAHSHTITTRGKRHGKSQKRRRKTN